MLFSVYSVVKILVESPPLSILMRLPCLAPPIFARASDMPYH